MKIYKIKRSVIDKKGRGLYATRDIKAGTKIIDYIGKLITKKQTEESDKYDNGKPIFHAKDLIANLSNMGKVVDGLSRLEEIVKKEEQAANTNRGGVEVNKYSM